MASTETTGPRRPRRAPGTPRIDVLSIETGRYPAIAPLNPMFRPDAPALKTTLEIRWRPADPHEAVARLEARLAELSPSLREHACRGPSGYRVFRASGGGAPDDDGFEPALALAHLVEHVVIDTVSFVTGAPRVSGLTGAHRRRRRRFDLFVECPGEALARLAIGLAVRWTLDLLRRGRVDGPGRAVLDVARHLWRAYPSSVEAAGTAGALTCPPALAGSALEWLHAQGFARRDEWALNFSDLPRYAATRDGGSP